MANAGVDRSNTGSTDPDRVLLVPEDADASAERLRHGIAALLGRAPAVVISDSFGRPWRNGVVSVAIGASGLPALIDKRGELDRDGRILGVTQIALADIATAASLATGEGAEGVPAALVRGAAWPPGALPASALVRPLAEDLSMTGARAGKVVVLTGGVGGAKLVLGLAQVMPPERITAIVNTADDFRHLGLWVSPDIDTLLYTLSGRANTRLGWGREVESWNFMAALTSLGGEDWFNLGDGDLALHILRTARLAAGEKLSAIIDTFAKAWAIPVTVLPMSDDPISTYLATDEGELAFQRYFVERRCAPVVSAIRFEGVAQAKAGPGVLEAISDRATTAILIAPSNPYVSVDPVLVVPGLRAALREARAPVVAVSPIVGGQAVKGPTAKLMGELGAAVAPAAIAAHYRGIIDALLIDERDGALEIGIDSAFADTLMLTLADRARVAAAALALADRTRR